MVRGVVALCLLSAACLDSPGGPMSQRAVDAAAPGADAGFGDRSGLPMNALVDDFDDALLSNWTPFTTNELTCRFTWLDDDVSVVNDGEADHCGLLSKKGYDLTDDATWLVIENDTRPTGDPGFEYRVYLAATRYIVIELNEDSLQAGRCIDGGCALGSPVDSNQMFYWRVWHDSASGLVIADASSNMANWTPLAEMAESDVSCAHLEVASYSNPAGENAPAVIDGVDID